MQGIATGMLGWTLSDFENATLRELDNAFKAFRQVREYNIRHEWEIARWKTLWLLSPQVKKQSMPSVKNAMQFPWEKPERAEFKGDVKAILEKWDQIPFKA